ncbi:MAG TPA: TonB family protein [Alphaproteobacteria bacterium]|nr:TonB family protein [Alphaproteobacteria bacterium]
MAAGLPARRDQETVTVKKEPRLGPLGSVLGDAAATPEAADAVVTTPAATASAEAAPAATLAAMRDEHAPLSRDAWGAARRAAAQIGALLLHLAILVFLFGPSIKEAPVEPPPIPVEIVTLPPPKPKVAPQPKPPPKPAPKPRPSEPPPPLEHLESGGNPDLAPGRPAETKAPETAQQAAQETPTPTPQPPPPEAKPAPRTLPKAQQQAPLRPQPTLRETARSHAPAPPLKLPPTEDKTAPPQLAALPPPSRSVPRAAPQGAPVTASAPAQIESELRGQGGGDRYLNAMRDEIVSNLIYPSAGRGQKGVARYEMVVGRNGYVLQLRLVQSSGSPALDRAGMDAIQNSAPFQPLPPNVPGEYVGIRVVLYIGPS